MSLLQMSMSGAVLILLIAAARTALITRLPKISFALLWSVALLRLLLPVSLPSKLSIYTWLSRSQAIGSIIPRSPISVLLPISQTAGLTPTAASGNADLFAADSVWAAIWTIGLAVCALYFTGVYLTSYCKFRASIPADNEFIRQWLSTHRIIRQLEIRQTDKISSPLTYGFFRPVILIPASTPWDNREQLSYIFEHEYIHIRRNDLITKLILTAALCIHWFNPAVWLMYTLFNRDIELICDQTVIKNFGLDSRSSYARAIIDMEERRSYSPSLCNYFSRNSIEERIVAIMKTKHCSAAYYLLSAVLVLCAITVFSSSAQASAADANAAEWNWKWPTLSREVSLGFGEHVHPITGQSFDYDHIYIAGKKDDPVFSSTDGVVSKTGYDSCYGYHIVINSGDSIEVLYGHLDKILVEEGSRVAAGEQIGSMGATGDVVGDCLAYAVFDGGIALDPLGCIQ